MEIQLFTLPLIPQKDQIEELNLFLRSHKVIDIRKEIAMADGNSVWTFCITYLPNPYGFPNISSKGGKVDYKEVLDEEAFKRFSDLRKIRKAIADEEAIPAYAVFTDAELADIAKMNTVSIASIQSVQGVGKKKVEKYAERIVTDFNNMKDETNGISH